MIFLVLKLFTQLELILIFWLNYAKSIMQSRMNWDWLRANKLEYWLPNEPQIKMKISEWEMYFIIDIVVVVRLHIALRFTWHNAVNRVRSVSDRQRGGRQKKNVYTKPDILTMHFFFGCPSYLFGPRIVIFCFSVIVETSRYDPWPNIHLSPTTPCNSESEWKKSMYYFVRAARSSFKKKQHNRRIEKV